MGLIVAGAAGRMGRALVRTVHETPGVKVLGALERTGATELGADAGELAGIGRLGVQVTDDALSLFAKADGVLDFTSPARRWPSPSWPHRRASSMSSAPLAWPRLTTQRLRAAARHAVIVRSGNMSLGVNLLAALVETARRGRSTPTSTSKSWRCTTATRSTRRPARRCCSGEAAAEGRGVDLSDNAVRGRDGITGARSAAPSALPRCAAARLSASTPSSSPARASGSNSRIAPIDRSIFARGAIKAALWGRDKKPGLYSMADVLGLEG